LRFCKRKIVEQKEKVNQKQKSSMAKKKFYAVAVGRKVGIYDTWDECEKQVRK
jgi:hypothetical protein